MALEKMNSIRFDKSIHTRLSIRVLAIALNCPGMDASAAMTQGDVHAYPSKPIRIIVPFSPGGAGDTLMRFAGQKLTDAWGQPSIVDNRAGASGAIGLQMAAKSLPDGYTLVHGTASTHTINPI